MSKGLETTSTVPEMGTPEFREFVQTPEWVEMRHEQALEDDLIWEQDPGAIIPEVKFMEQFTARTPYFRPLRLGATAISGGVKLWARDWREGLPVDHPKRMDYEESIHGKTEAALAAEDIGKLSLLQDAILRSA